MGGVFKHRDSETVFTIAKWWYKILVRLDRHKKRPQIYTSSITHRNVPSKGRLSDDVAINKKSKMGWKFVQYIPPIPHTPGQ